MSGWGRCPTCGGPVLSDKLKRHRRPTHKGESRTTWRVVYACLASLGIAWVWGFVQAYSGLHK